MEGCIICKSLCNKKQLLCNECKKNPFRVEDLRDILAQREELRLLKHIYTDGLAEVRDINSPDFWDKLLVKNREIEKQSPITKERIKTATKMIDRLRGRLLDIGFGYGFIEEYISPTSHFDLYGIEISRSAVERIKKIIRGKFSIGSILKIPFGDKLFDVVLTLEILEHIPPHNTHKAISELYRVLKNGGILIVSVPLNEGLEEMCGKGINPNGHVRVYTPTLIKAELKMGGFKIQQEKYLFAFKNLYWFKNLLRKTLLKNRWQPNNIVILAVK